MGTFGREFFNVMVPDNERGLPAVNPSNAGPGLRAFILAASRHADNAGGIVYLPPLGPDIPYVINQASPARANDFTAGVNEADLLVGENVLLWFAPGAFLQLDPEVVVRINGSIRAELKRIFRSVPPTGTQRRGRVVFQTSKVLELYPEWWGAVPTPMDQLTGRTVDDTQALEDCFLAAHTDRAFDNATFTVLPVIFSGVYHVSREIVVEPKALRPNDATHNASIRRNFTGRANAAGLVILGRNGTTTSNVQGPGLTALSTFAVPSDARALTGRAVLRLNGLHGCVFDGLIFDGGHTAPASVQISGENARGSTFRRCTFTRATNVLLQVGDYVVEGDGTNMVGATALPTRHVGVKPSYDLSGLTLSFCTFDSAIGSAPGDRERALAVSGLVFQATATLPMVMESCHFWGRMRANVEAYGGALVVRGGTSQNELVPLPTDRNPSRRHRPRGGVDFFLGDVLLLSPGEGAETPTGLTVIGFESQSYQFLDTFRHVSVSSGRTRFLPTVLQNVTARYTGPEPAAPVVFWSGPSIRGTTTSGPFPTFSGNGSPLTLVGCQFRRRATQDLPRIGGAPPAGGVVIDSLAVMVADVGTRNSPYQDGTGSSAIFWEFNRMATGGADPYRDVPSLGNTDQFPWYYRM